MGGSETIRPFLSGRPFFSNVALPFIHPNKAHTVRRESGYPIYERNGLFAAVFANPGSENASEFLLDARSG